MDQAHRHQRLRRALHTLEDDLVSQLQRFHLITSKPPHWVDTLQRQVLPAVDYDVPVILVAICGGGSTGKSTLFNALSRRTVSATGFKAGLTQRSVLCGHPDIMEDDHIVQNILFRFKTKPVRWEDPDDATRQGAPLVISSRAMRRNLVLIDTPDFDTGEGEQLRNRELAMPALQTSEILLYIFTNAIYNNASNTEFMRDILGAVGGREAILVYRVSRVLEDDEALKHIRKVATNLYPGSPLTGHAQLPEQVLGCYRVHESDEIALGKRTPGLEPLAETPLLDDLLSEIDVGSLKQRVLDRELEEVTRGARTSLAAVRTSSRQVELFREALDKLVVMHATQALRSFPKEEAFRLVQVLWNKSSPRALRLMRGTGKVVASPLYLAYGAYSRTRDWMRGEGLTARDKERIKHEAMEKDLIEGANRLRVHLLKTLERLHVTEPHAGKRHTLPPIATLVQEYLDAHGTDDVGLPRYEVTGSGEVNAVLPTPPLLREPLNTLETLEWQQLVAELRARVPELAGISPEIRQRIESEVSSFRENMSSIGKVREALFSGVAVLPPVLAVTYVLSTGDPVTGSTIAVKLGSVFGIQDLWAVMTIPASTGLNEVDRKQLAAMLGPIINRWFESRVLQVRDLYRRLLLTPVEEAINASLPADAEVFTTIESAIAFLEEEPEP